MGDRKIELAFVDKDGEWYSLDDPSKVLVPSTLGYRSSPVLFNAVIRPSSNLSRIADFSKLFFKT